MSNCTPKIKLQLLQKSNSSYFDCLITAHCPGKKLIGLILQNFNHTPFQAKPPRKKNQPTSPAGPRLGRQPSLPAVVARGAGITLGAVLQPLSVAEGSHWAVGSQWAPLQAVSACGADVAGAAICGGGVVGALQTEVARGAQAWRHGVACKKWRVRRCYIRHGFRCT